MGARSEGCSTACKDFIPTACMRNIMTWEEPGMLGWTWTESEFARGCVARIMEEDDSVLSYV